ncbi:FAD:protein FMN transferase [Alcaligenes faecalis]|uniref:FAD:protein FMN transferase n=1 Tax=Alcaligenes faecalis TaxID=511 RepID=UPI001293945D|nr:FAD:protein FMN transferase [Alcaligenes faecalis]MBX6965550.1 FAD:protein FMN transferase [Providencia rettgeri]MBX7030747.1 FAD:protein FMN transferase [Alcaligenes faecalis]QFY76948.1 FAD:protein FMN transferase [Alcaligenes faecalis]
MPKTSSEPQRLTLNGPTMGTRWSAIVETADTIEVAGLQQDLADAVQQVDRQMSPWLADSDLNRLNRTPPGTWLDLPPAILEVLACALDINRRSQGAFDPGLGDVVAAWGFGPARSSPDASAIRRAAKACPNPAYDTLELDMDAGRAIKHAAIQLDLCGIAKGYAVDRMALVLRQHGIKHALLALDGELRALNSQYQGQPWAVAIEYPQPGLRSTHSVVELHDLSIATSGDYRNFIQLGDVRVAHTMDSKRRAPVRNDIASVTVLAPDCMQADAWATALLASGSDGMALAQRMGIEALWLLRRNNILTTVGLGRFSEAPAHDTPV